MAEAFLEVLLQEVLLQQHHSVTCYGLGYISKHEGLHVRAQQVCVMANRMP